MLHNFPFKDAITNPNEIRQTLEQPQSENEFTEPRFAC